MQEETLDAGKQKTRCCNDKRCCKGTESHLAAQEKGPGHILAAQEELLLLTDSMALDVSPPELSDSESSQLASLWHFYL